MHLSFQGLCSHRFSLLSSGGDKVKLNSAETQQAREMIAHTLQTRFINWRHSKHSIYFSLEQGNPFFFFKSEILLNWRESKSGVSFIVLTYMYIYCTSGIT